jgi:hypothetical protein
MGRNRNALIGICGLYCGSCPCYLAYRENDSEQLSQVSRETGLPLEKVRCDGCLSDRVMPHCRECRHGFRQCARDKQVTWCFQCPDFPCRRLEKFTGSHIVNGVSHHAHVIEDLHYMREHGPDQWVNQQEKAGTCPQCGKKLYWFATQCPSCHNVRQAESRDQNTKHQKI